MTKKKETAVATATELIDVEVVESTTEELMYNDIKELISLKKNYDSSLETITEESNNILNSFFEIGKELKYIQDNKLYLIDGYKNIYELAEEKFNFKKTSCHNMINVYDKYKNNSGKEIDEKYEEYSFSSLVELLPVPKEEITKENFNPDMTVKEIRTSKAKIQLSEHFRKMADRFQEVEKLFEEKVKEYNAEESNKKLHIKITKCRYDLSEDNFNPRIEYSIAGGHSYYYFSLNYNDYDKKIYYHGKNIMDAENNILVVSFVEDMKLYVKYAIDKLKSDEEAKKDKEKAKKELERINKLNYKMVSLNHISWNKRDFYLIYKFIYDFLLNGLIDFIYEYSIDDNFRYYEMNKAYVLYLRKKNKEICKLIFAEGTSGYYLAFDYSKKEYESSDKLITTSNVVFETLKDKEKLLQLINNEYTYLLNLLKDVK